MKTKYLTKTEKREQMRKKLQQRQHLKHLHRGKEFIFIRKNSFDPTYLDAYQLEEPQLPQELHQQQLGGKLRRKQMKKCLVLPQGLSKIK